MTGVLAPSVYAAAAAAAVPEEAEFAAAYRAALPQINEGYRNYLDEKQKAGADSARKREAWSKYSAENLLPLIKQYAWAMPTAEALDAIASYGPLVEIGAGGGYWAHLLQETRQTQVFAYDTFDDIPERWPITGQFVDMQVQARLAAHPEWQQAQKDMDEETRNLLMTALARGILARTMKEANFLSTKFWFDVQKGDENKISEHPALNLFLCYPSQKGAASRCLQLFTGNAVIFIGNWAQTGDEAFHVSLQENFDLVKSVKLPAWPGHDDIRVWCYERKKSL